MSTPPPSGEDGTEPLEGAAARWGSQPTSEPVSLDKDVPADFDPYRFGKPDYPIAPEYAPPGYSGPVTAPQPAPYGPPPGYPTYGSQPPPYPPYGSQPPPSPNFPSVPPPPPYNLHYPPPRTGNGKAIAAMVLGIGSIVFCWLSIFDALLIIPAIIFGAIALTEANRRPAKEGRSMAITGLSCALVGAVLATVLTVVYYNKLRDCFDLQRGSSEYNQCINQRI
ncbi:MAG: DUF4190 domain-containing protein [Jatrophihabitantaceae bacterium]